MMLSQSLAITPETGSVVAGRLGLSGALDVIGVVARGPDYPLDAPAVEAWLPLARRAVQARNEAIHTPWVASAEGGELNAVIRKGHKLESRSGSDLDKIVTLLHEAVVAGRALLKLDS
jgi:hypothetical protein